MKLNTSIIKSIAINTFRETVRDKLLYSLIGFAVLTIAASLLAGSVSLGQDARVIQNFGITALLVFLLIITIFIGTQLVYREIERKTIYLTLSKPLTRESFYLGKYIGLCLTIAVSALVMGVVFLAVLRCKTGQFSTPVIWATSFVILEAWLLTAVGLLFSSFTSALASAVYTFGIVLIGHSATTIWILSQKSQGFLRYVLEVVYYLFPNLEKFNLRNEIVYNFQPDLQQVLLVIAYFIAYTAAVLLAGLAIFRRDEF